MPKFEIGDRVQATGTVVGWEGTTEEDIENVEVLWDILDGSDTDPKSLQWGHDPAGLIKIPPLEPPIGSVVEVNGNVLMRGRDGRWFNPFGGGDSCLWGTICRGAKIIFVKETE